MPDIPYEDWKTLSEAASREQDPKKLLELVEQLNRVLGEREEEMKRRRSASMDLLMELRTDDPEELLSA
jgi:hypothetical protein